MKTKRKIMSKLISLIVLTCIIAILARNGIIKILYKKDYAEYVKTYSAKYEIDENLIFAVIKAESNFVKNAMSPSNACGLMQLMEGTAIDMAKDENIEINDKTIFEPEINIMLGTKYLSKLIQKYNNIEIALAAYNAGMANVDEWIKNGILKEDGSNIENIPFKETNNYVRKILRDYKIYNNL